MKNFKKSFQLAFPYTLPILAGYIFMGIAFGLLMHTAGFPAHWSILMSLIVYSGALEFAAIPILGAAFDPIGSFILAVMLSARHLFYGIPLLKKYNPLGLKKWPLAFWLSDETFAIISTTEVPEEADPVLFYYIISSMNYMYWNIGTILGFSIGRLIGDRAEGLDFVLTALFVVMFIDSLKSREETLSGFIGLFGSILALAVLGPSKMVLGSMIIILVVLLCGKKGISNE